MGPSSRPRAPRDRADPQGPRPAIPDQPVQRCRARLRGPRRSRVQGRPVCQGECFFAGRAVVRGAFEVSPTVVQYSSTKTKTRMTLRVWMREYQAGRGRGSELSIKDHEHTYVQMS